MDTVTILRDLWRLRVAVAAIALWAILVGTAVMFKLPSFESRKHEVGVATARILVDTPSSQVVEVAPKGSDSLGVRANLLASLMADGDVKAAIAERAGLPPDKLVGVTEAAAEPAAAAAPPSAKDFVLTTSVLTNTGGDQLPIIEVTAQAPTRAAAARIGTAAVEGLGDYLDSTAARQEIADADRLNITGLGAPVAVTEVRGPSNLMAGVAVIFIFVLCCAGLLGIRALISALRAASGDEPPAGAHGLAVAEDLRPPSTSAASTSLFSDVETDDGEEPPVIVVPSRRTRAKSA